MSGLVVDSTRSGLCGREYAIIPNGDDDETQDCAAGSDLTEDAHVHFE